LSRPRVDRFGIYPSLTSSPATWTPDEREHFQQLTQPNPEAAARYYRRCYARAYRQANKSSIRNYNRDTYHQSAAHRQAVIDRTNKWVQAHKAERAAYMRQYRRGKKEQADANRCPTS
jgi:hypothetical protein